MIQEVIKQWEAHKSDLENYFRNNPMSEYDSYDKVMGLIIGLILNAGDDSMDIIPEYKVLDDGDYQGTRIYVLHTDTYQPDLCDYIITHNYYGSCSGCDTLLSITEYDGGIPDEDQVKGFMTISLHLVQNMRYLSELYAREPAVW